MGYGVWNLNPPSPPLLPREQKHIIFSLYHINIQERRFSTQKKVKSTEERSIRMSIHTFQTNHKCTWHFAHGFVIAWTFEDIFLLSLKLDGEEMHSHIQTALLLLSNDIKEERVVRKNAFILRQVQRKKNTEFFLCSLSFELSWGLNRYRWRIVITNSRFPIMLFWSMYMGPNSARKT